MKTFEILDEVVICRQPAGLQGYYARVVPLSDTELVCSFVASTTIEGPDCHPEITRSCDGGRTWNLEGPVDRNRPAQFPPTETGFISRDADGSVMCLGARWKVDPARPEEGLVHPVTLGMRENDVVLRRSSDGGRTWTEGAAVPKPLDCPYEIPTGMLALDDGTLMMSFATWRCWDGSLPHGHNVYVMRSADHGRTWAPPVPVFRDPAGRLGFWEGRVVQAGGDRLIATCWAHDWEQDQDVANHYAISHDRGRTWSEPRPAPVTGQTGWPLWLGDDTLLFVYNHRRQPVGVRAQVFGLKADRWEPGLDAVVWSPENRAAGAIGKGNYGVTDFQFGAPSAIRLARDRVMVVYWCVVAGRAGIHATRLELK